MEISKATRLLKLCVSNRMPALLVGPPGVGKSDIAAQVASELKMDLLVSHPVVADPTDAKGLPFADKKGESARFLPFGDLAKALSATKPMVWMLDDLGQAAPAVQASFMQLLLARHIGEHKLPDCVTFVAATNRKGDRSGVTGMLEAVKSRFANIIPVEPSVDAWVDWALGNRMPGELIAFLRLRPDLLLADAPKADISNNHCPRTWASLGRLFNAGIDDDLRLEAITGAVGEAAGTELNEFLSVWREMPSPDAILLNPQAGDIPQEVSTLYALTSALAHYANAENFHSVARYAQRLQENGKGEMASYLLRDSVRRSPELTGCSGYAQAICGPLGELFA